MSAIVFLFSRELVYFTRWVLLITGYDLKKRELSEQLYGLYVLLILVGWAVAMLSWAVVTLTQFLAGLRLPTGAVYYVFFFGLAFWLAITPWRAQGSNDLYRFSLPDFDFLSTSPFSPSLIAVAWFLKALFRRESAIFVVGCGIIAGSLGELEHKGDLVGLIYGLVASASFFTAASALLWLLALLRYYPTPRFGTPAGSMLTLLGIALIFIFPASQPVFWPSWLASLLISRDIAGNEALWATLGLLLTAVVGVVAVYFVARPTLMASAFEEGRFGSQLRGVTSGGLVRVSDTRIQVHLARSLARGRAVSGAERTQPIRLGGPTAALLRKQWLRMQRLSPGQLLYTLLVPIGLGVVIATALVLLAQNIPRFEVLAVAGLIANLAFVRVSTNTLHNDLAHIGFFAGWPISRLRLMLSDAFIDMALPFAGGEIALVILGVAGESWAGISWGLIATWLLLWPMLLAITCLTAVLGMWWLTRRWAASPETVPDTGPAVLIIAATIWLGATFWGPLPGLAVAAVMLAVYLLVLQFGVT